MSQTSVEGLNSDKICNSGEISARADGFGHDDDKFLATALSASASHIVSGDKDLLELDQFKGIRIVSPRAFIKAI